MIELIGNKIFLDDNYEIREYITEDGIVRAFISDECIHSLMYIDKEKRNKLGMSYFNYYNIPIELNPNGSEYLMLGGGIVSYPHYYLNKYKDKKIDIIEINKECINYAKKYFFLDELIQDNKDRISVIIDDAINYITYTKKQYDYILIDLFNGREPIREIYSEENAVNLKKILKSDGIILINYILINNNYIDELKEIIKISKNYKIISSQKHFDITNNKGNIIIVLSNREINIPYDYNYIDVNNLVKL